MTGEHAEARPRMLGRRRGRYRSRYPQRDTRVGVAVGVAVGVPVGIAVCVAGGSVPRGGGRWWWLRGVRSESALAAVDDRKIDRQLAIALKSVKKIG